MWYRHYRIHSSTKSRNHNVDWLFVLFIQFGLEPCFCKIPVTPNGFLGYAHHIRNLLDAQSDEPAQLDYTGRTGINLLEALQHLIQSQNVVGLCAYRERIAWAATAKKCARFCQLRSGWAIRRR